MALHNIAWGDKSIQSSYIQKIENIINPTEEKVQELIKNIHHRRTKTQKFQSLVRGREWVRKANASLILVSI